MEITEKLHTTSREQWRDWLIENHSTKREIWISTTKSPDGLQYLDAVEEALCFGWIDSTIKAGEGVMWRRFSPRRKRSPWTELNKERYRRLERLGLMTDAGRADILDIVDVYSHIERGQCLEVLPYGFVALQCSENIVVNLKVHIR